MAKITSPTVIAQNYKENRMKELRGLPNVLETLELYIQPEPGLGLYESHEILVDVIREILEANKS